MGWPTGYKKILPYVFAVETPDGSGSGVFLTRNEAGNIAAVATAAHVVEHAEAWKLPIKLRHHSTAEEVFLDESSRVIFVDKARDSATILFPVGTYKLPEHSLTMIDEDKYKTVGTEVGWVGFPSIADPNLCFFSGRISAYLKDSYLVDGVAINGVSGGPVFALQQDDAPQLLGTVSAYMPNRLHGNTLPGLLSAQDVTHFHEVVKTMKSMDEARRKQSEVEAKKLQDEAAAQQPPAGQQPMEGGEPAAPVQ